MVLIPAIHKNQFLTSVNAHDFAEFLSGGVSVGDRPGFPPVWPMWEDVRPQHTMSPEEPLAMVFAQRDLNLT